MASQKKSTITDLTNSLTNKSIHNTNCLQINDSFALNDKNNSNKEEISLIQDSSDDLQWCTEADYHYEYKSSSDQSSSYSRSVPKSIFETSILGSSNSYATPPTSNYAELDANLAEIDIETFKSEDINAVFLQQAGEDCASLSTSIFEDSISSASYRSTNGLEQQSTGLSFEGTNGDNSSVGIDSNAAQLREKMVGNDISVDSLDMSLFETNTSKLLMKCTERDKKNYTIAFEGSISGSEELNGSNLQKRSTFSELDYLRNEVNDRKMTKSEHLIRSLNRNLSSDRINRNINDKSERLIQEIDKSIAKLTQSIPDLKSLMRMTGQCKIPYCPVSGFLPLYDLQSSQSSNSHSSGSEFSPPRSLLRMFMQNRSPHSSEQISPSLSYESRSQESASGNASDPSFKPLYYNILELTREANNNILLENRSARLSSTEEMTGLEDNSPKSKTRFDSQRMLYDLKHTFPIKEVDEDLSDSSNTDINMSSVETNEMNANFSSDFNRNSLKSYENYSNPNSLSNSNTNGSGIAFNTRFGAQNMNTGNTQRSKPQMHSSVSNTRSTSTQIPLHIQDKEVQASIRADDSFQFVVKQIANPMTSNRMPVMTPESPNDCNKPFYVYYPNYSLPDLSFLEQILEEHTTCAPQTVFLSPTKHELPNRDSVSVKMRRKARPKCRPKSYTDFETLSKQNFSHIKDWDSLNILLPIEFKELIQKAKNVSNEANNESKIERNENMFNEYNSVSNRNTVRMRSHRSNGQLSDNSSTHSNRGYVRNKRYSLQEYPHYPYPYPPVDELQTDCHNISHNMPTGCMTRSQTMPNCHNSCHCHQHCCHNCCHSCCRTPRQSPSTENPFPQTHSCDLNMNSIDKLCQLLAMDLSFKKIMTIINGQNVSSNPSNVETVAENKAENENNFVIKSNNNNNCVEETVEQNKSVDDLTDKDSSNFKELKQRWETLACVGPTDAKPVANANTNTKDCNPLKANPKQKSNDLMPIAVKPEIARKPQIVLRRPQSSIPRPTTLNTETPIHSHRKSLIPVPKAGQSKPPVIYATKVKSNIALKLQKS